MVTPYSSRLLFQQSSCSKCSKLLLTRRHIEHLPPRRNFPTSWQTLRSVGITSTCLFAGLCHPSWIINAWSLKPLRCGSRLPWVVCPKSIILPSSSNQQFFLPSFSWNNSNLVQPKHILKAFQSSIYPPSLSRWLHKQQQQRHFAIQVLGQVLPELLGYPSLCLPYYHFKSAACTSEPSSFSFLFIQSHPFDRNTPVVRYPTKIILPTSCLLRKIFFEPTIAPSQVSLHSSFLVSRDWVNELFSSGSVNIRSALSSSSFFPGPNISSHKP